MGRLRQSLGSAALVLAVTAAGARAGTITVVNISNDVDSGISSAKTYTHRLDLVDDGAAATINGVAFTAVGGDPADFQAVNTATYPSNYSASGVPNGFHSDPPGVTDGTGLETLLADFHYGQDPFVITLSGLTPGTTYDTRIYSRAFGTDTRNATITFDGEAGPVGADDTLTGFDQNPGQNAEYISYVFTADGTSEVITIDSLTGNTFHTYAITNEVVPEPASLSLLALGGLGLLARRRRGR